ncbi:PD40 domain-containing protein [Candidatus Poribacteria bacterium]|nr:PD40 domain-containing protein [Candidatus Poribacteria bacterium]
MKIYLYSIALFLCVLTLGLAQEQPAGVLLFSTWDNLSLMSPDGKQSKLLVSLGGQAAWSPDSRSIALAAKDLYVMAHDGSGQRNLTNRGEWCWEPQWSPDASKIAFTLGGVAREVFVIDSNGNNLINLSNHPASDTNPTWSPDGKRITFMSERDGNWEVYAVDSDGQNLINLTNNPADDRYPAWSPFISKIAFISNRDGNSALYLMDADGQNVEQLFQPAHLNVTWSPDGSEILFIVNFGMSSILITNLASRVTRRLTQNYVDFAPCWSPDGQYIAFRRQFFGPGLDEWKIKTNGTYVMQADGSNLARISPLEGMTDWGMPPLDLAIQPAGKLPIQWATIKHR